MTDLEFDDVAVFFGKFTKENNDKTNKIRENIILQILNNQIPKTWYSSPEWFKVALRLKEFIKENTSWYRCDEINLEIQDKDLAISKIKEY